MKNPAHWSKEDLHQHLQHAVDVEFWTIPLYLTALYSIKGLKDLQHRDYPDAAKLIESVVIQEMLHLELVCNISNALGHSPHFHPPQYHNGDKIPFIHPKKDTLPKHLHDYECRPGALNESTLKLFCAIELPQEQKEIPWEDQKSYHSLADLYTALKLGIQQLWNECYVGDTQNTRQKGSFKEYTHRSGRHHGFSVEVNSLATALSAIEAIVEQGEGADSRNVAADFRPPKQQEGKEFDPGWFKGELSHYHKFSTLLHHYRKLPEVYPLTTTEDTPEQQALNIAYRVFLDELNKSFHTTGSQMTKTFWNNMFSMSNAIIAVWDKGACPKFEIR